MKLKIRILSVKSVFIYFIVISGCVFLILLFFSLNQQRQKAVSFIQKNYSNFSSYASKRQSMIINGVRILPKLSEFYVSPDPEANDFEEMLISFLGNHSYFSNIFLADSRGNVLTNVFPLIEEINFSNDQWFQDAVNSKNLALSIYHINQSCDCPVIFIAYPILDEKDRVEKILVVAENLNWLVDLLPYFNLSPDNIITIFNSEKTVLFRYPANEEIIGKKVPYYEDKMPKQGIVQIKELRDDNGEKWLHAITPVEMGDYTDNNIFISISTPLSILYSPINRQIFVNALISISIISVVFLSIWIVINNLFLIPIDKLNRATVHIIKGNYDFRVKPPIGYGELKQLAEVFNLTINTLDRREKDLKIETKKSRFYTRVLKKTLNDVVDAICSLMEFNDQYTSIHQKRVSELTLLIAKELGLNKKDIEGLRVASLLHDIGKISLPNEILTKSEQLTGLETQIIRDHPSCGYEILKNIRFRYPIALIILQHHERLNGSGYPQSLKSDEIHFGAKILMVADVVEAMVSHRPYRPAPGLGKALEEITKNKGILYDERVVDCCIQLLREKKNIFTHSYHFFDEEKSENVEKNIPT